MTGAPYMTVVASRTPKRKAHVEFGDVRRAVHFHNSQEPVEVHRWVDGVGWALLWEIAPKTKKEDLPWA